ncbi:energy transducer TonB [Granulicella sp. dw_53]|uniref:energy transducer TonB n=1 Tax=Granulicella sp. dw_53 TaxID=2719792 RepID=UPI001BD2301A|nr:energy transducer TonB [Granulicella sp. dw_53]
MRVRAVLFSVLAGLVWVGRLGAVGQTTGGKDAMQEASKGPVGSESNPVRVSSGAMSGSVLHQVNPTFPPFPEGTQLSGGGTTIMAATIDKAGKIVKLEVISGREATRDGILKAVRQWTFKPYLLNGEPVYVRTTIVLEILFGR